MVCDRSFQYVDDAWSVSRVVYRAEDAVRFDGHRTHSTLALCRALDLRAGGQPLQVDRLRRERTYESKLALLADLVPEPEDEIVSSIPDERLALIFTCCDPALAVEAQVALTLRLLGGLTTRGDRRRPS